MLRNLKIRSAWSGVRVGGTRAWLSIKMPTSGRKTRSLEEQMAKLKQKVFEMVI